VQRQRGVTLAADIDRVGIELGVVVDRAVVLVVALADVGRRVDLHTGLRADLEANTRLNTGALVLAITVQRALAGVQHDVLCCVQAFLRGGVINCQSAAAAATLG